MILGIKKYFFSQTLIRMHGKIYIFQLWAMWKIVFFFEIVLCMLNASAAHEALSIIYRKEFLVFNQQIMIIYHPDNGQQRYVYWKWRVIGRSQTQNQQMRLKCGDDTAKSSIGHVENLLLGTFRTISIVNLEISQIASTF